MSANESHAPPIRKTPGPAWLTPRGVRLGLFVLLPLLAGGATAFVGAATLRPGLSLVRWWAPSPTSPRMEQRHHQPGGGPAPSSAFPPFAVTIREPAIGPPLVATGQVDAHGRPITVSCNTCHLNNLPPNPSARLGRALTNFHQHLSGGKHGDLTCASCHNPADGYQSLRLADGRSVPYSHVMQLCAQCHGPQYRDYLHGVHGGMTGHWDLNKGPRVRNNCTHCHDPHAPRYPVVQPVRGPGDLPAQKNRKGATSHD